MFLVILVIFTAIGESLAIVSGNIFGAKGFYVQLIMWSPAAAATLTALIAKMPLKVFGWKWGDWKWQIRAWFTRLVYAALAYGLIWTMGSGRA
jgi:phosphoglycerol transferase MdoB-like AlkP superfamily enzyme